MELHSLLPCPCCRFPTLSESNAFEICLICWWEDDGQDDRDAREGHRAGRQGFPEVIYGQGKTPEQIAAIAAGAVGSRWVPWSSKPVAGLNKARCGFDSHTLPPFSLIDIMTDHRVRAGWLSISRLSCQAIVEDKKLVIGVSGGQDSTVCLAWALETGQDAGVWGGLSEDERRALKRRNARARARMG